MPLFWLPAGALSLGTVELANGKEALVRVGADAVVVCMVVGVGSLVVEVESCPSASLARQRSVKAGKDL